MLLEERDFAVLKELACHPTAPISDIAKQLHYRPETVSAHIKELQGKGIYQGTMALLSYKRLDLLYVPVLIKAPLINLPKVYATIRKHPYCAYSVRTIGASEGAFAVFTIPSDSLPQLAEFLDRLAAEGIITDHRIYVADDSARDFLTPDLTKYDPNQGRWTYGLDKWQTTDEGHAADGASPILRRVTPVVQPGATHLETVDVKLLSALSDDAKIPTEELATKGGLLPHQVRRRIQEFENEGFIIGYRAMIRYSKLHLSSSMLFNCNAQVDAVEACRRKLLELPFPGSFIPVQNGFLCQATLPAEALPPVHQVLAQRCKNVEISWFDLPTSHVAVLNADCFTGNNWRADRSYVVDEPLKILNTLSG